MKKIILIIFPFFLVGIIACQKEKLPNNPPVSDNEIPSDTLTIDSCGCGVVTLDSLVNRTGSIKYVKTLNGVTLNGADTIIYNQLKIIDVNDIIMGLMVCSCDCNLPSEILNLKTSQDTISSTNVIYSGKLRKTCWHPKASTTNGAHYDIILTNIVIQ